MYDDADDPSLAGVGLVLQVRPTGIVVHSLLRGGAAHKDGKIQIGDALLAIDDFNVVGSTLDSVKNRLLGVAGTTVSLTLERTNGNREPYNLRLRRGSPEYLDQDQLEPLRRQLEASQAQLIAVRKALTASEQEAHGLKSEVDRLRTAHRSLDAELQRSKHSEEDERRERISLEQQLASVTEHSSRDKDENDKLRKLLADAVGKMKALQTQCNDASDKLQAEQEARRVEERKRRDCEDREKRVQGMIEQEQTQRRSVDIELKSAVHRLATVEGELRSKAITAGECESKLDEARDQINQLKSTVRELESDFRSATHRQQSEAIQLEQLRAKMLDEEAHLRVLKSELSTEEHMRRIAEEKADKLQDHILQLQKCVADKSDEVRTLTDKLAMSDMSVKESDAEWMRRLDAVEKERHADEMKIARLTHMVEVADGEKAELAQMIVDNTALQTEMARYRNIATDSAAEIRNLKNSLEDIMRLRDSVIQENEALRAEHCEVVAAVGESRRVLAMEKDKYLSASQLNKSLEEELETARGEHRKQKTDLSDVRRALALEIEIHSAHQFEKDKLAADLVAAQKKVTQLEGMIAELEPLTAVVKELHESRANNGTLKAKISQLERQISDGEASSYQLGQLQTDHSRLKAKVENYEEELYRLRSGASDRAEADAAISKLRSLAAQGERDAAELAATRRELSEIQSELAKCKGSLAETRGSETRTKIELQQEETLRREVEESQRAMAARLTALNEEASSLRIRASELTEKEHGASFQLQQLTRNYKLVSDSKHTLETELDHVRNELTQAVNDLQALRLSSQSAGEKYNLDLRTLKALEIEVARLKKENEELFVTVEETKRLSESEAEKRLAEARLKEEAIQREKKSRDALEAELWKSRDSRKRIEEANGRIAQLESDLQESLKSRSELGSAPSTRRGEPKFSDSEERKALLSRLAAMTSEVESITTERDRLRHDLDEFFKLPSPIGVGLDLECTGNRVIVNGIIHNLSAHLSGAIKVGDEIITINGKNVSHMQSATLRPILVGKRGTWVNLKVQRDGRQFEVSLRRGAFGSEYAVVSPEENDMLPLQSGSRNASSSGTENPVLIPYTGRSSSNGRATSNRSNDGEDGFIVT